MLTLRTAGRVRRVRPLGRLIGQHPPALLHKGGQAHNEAAIAGLPDFARPMRRTRPSSELGQFHRYQHMLMYGGAAALTFAVIVAFVINSVALIYSYTVRESDLLSPEVGTIEDIIQMAEASLRGNAHSVEREWNSGTEAPPAVVDQYERNGNTLELASPPYLPPSVVVGSSTSSHPTSVERRFAYLTERLLGSTSGIAARFGEVTAYLFSRDQSVLGVIVQPSPPSQYFSKLLVNRAALFATLTDPTGKELLSGDATRPTRNRQGMLVTPIRWLPPYDSPVSGNRSVRLASALIDSQEKPFGALVAEMPLTRLTDPLPLSATDGAFVLLARDGSIVTTASQYPVDKRAVDAARDALANGIGAVERRVNRSGYWLSGWTIGSTGWILVYVDSWSSLATRLRHTLLPSLLTTTAIIVLIWTLVLLFDHRVYRPVLLRSHRVFESERLSRTLIKTAPVGLGLISMKDGAPLLRSPTMVETSRRVVVPEPTLASELAARYRAHRQRDARVGEESMHEELTLPTCDSEPVDLAVSVVPERYRGEDVLVVAFTDVTARKRLEQHLREAREAADSANAAKSVFLATMSHEIRTPLNAVLGNLELLAQTQLDTRQRERLTTIRSSSDSLLSIISDVLDFSKIEAGEMTLEQIEFDALEVIARALTMFAPVAHAKHLRLAANLGTTTSLPMRGDPTRLMQVINNLLSNALKFTERGDVLLRMTVLDAATLQIEVEDTGIGMTDEQQRQVFEPFGQADATISRRFGGTGLGLTLCSRLMQAMGGSIAVRSEPDNGSCFTMRVPLGAPRGVPAIPQFDGEAIALVSAADASDAGLALALKEWRLTFMTYRHPALIEPDTLEQVEAVIFCGERGTWHADDERAIFDDASWVIECSTAGPYDPVVTGRVVRVSSFSLKGVEQALQHSLHGARLERGTELPQVLPRHLRVLVAEDNPANRRLFEEQLAMLGCEVTLAEDGQQALDELLARRFDVLITDLWMPVMDGYALANDVRARWPKMPIIAATASVTLEERKRCEQAGIGQVVTKPLSLARLRAALTQATGLPSVSLQAESERETPAADDGLLGERALPASMRESFLASFDQSLAALATAQRDNDATCVLAELHSLRGALRFFGDIELDEACARLQSAVREQGVAVTASQLDAFDVKVQATMLGHAQSARETLSMLVAAAKRVAPANAASRLLRIVQAALQETGADAEHSA
ncbi:response regulator [Paraburkholderia sp. MMS20-SJTR3]|uniref:histidine kinase n=1 Tax=Paraburkholderia sejongensis TaxID=2886946 RepID=A0ABS8K5X3_9BURK|nr:hybrid sensor histidine kinase/response regulator [Paraburkholderia sp. MMS20-SJTR3]MCC8397574.1 response regulator [Paraburkholderia sp. MMS20-SJTR3]